jgi:hypothetical protein
MRLIYPALTAAATHALLLGALVAGFGGDPAALVCASRPRAGSFPYEHIRPGFDHNGYDGQFYYAVARAPFGRHVTGLDVAPARQLRLLYPLACWAVSGGDPRLLLWTMPLVNLVAVAGLAWLGALLAARQGLTPWWGVLLPLAVNAGLPALRDLTDAVATLALAALLVAWLLRAPWWTVALCGAAAVFSREQNAAGLAVVFACAAWQRRWLTCAGLAAALALWGGWVAHLWHLYQIKPFLPSEGNFDRPVAGLWSAWTHLGPGANRAARALLCLLLLAFQTALALDLVRRRAVDPAVRLTALFVVGLTLVGGPAIYDNPWSFARVYAGLPLAVWLGCVQMGRRWPLPPLSAYLLVQWGTVLKEVFARST